MKWIYLLIFAIFITLPVSAKTYDFGTVASERFFNKMSQVYVPAGALVYARLNDNISSENNNTNDTITAQLLKDWRCDAKVIAPEGSLVIGKIQEKKDSSFAFGDAKIYIEFNKVIRPDGVEINFESKPIIITGSSSGADRFWGVISTAGLGLLVKGSDNISIPFGTEFRINIISGINTTYYNN